MAKSVEVRNQRPENGSQELEVGDDMPSVLRRLSVVIYWLAMLIFTFHASTHMVAAGDTWVAMASGRHFVNHGVDTVEPFSANSHKPGPTEEEVKTWPSWAQWITEKAGLETVKKWHPTGWINQNWLTHMLFYTLIPKSSYADGVSFPSNALVYWKFTIYILTVICVYYTGRLLGANPWLCAVFSCFAMFTGRSFLDIRPAGFSNMLVAVFLLVLALTMYRNVLYIWLVVPVTVFWCNVHGGYIYAFIMLFPFVGLLLPTSIQDKKTLILSITVYLVIVACLGIVIHLSWLRIVFMFFAYIVLSAFLRHFKSKFISISQKGLCHTVIAALVTFVAVVLFNPFHLTNLTHTFAISVSEHAARWRNIHEWHPAFDWTNPVGTGFPFLVLCILGSGLLILWLFSHYLKSKCQTVHKKQYEAQKKVIAILLKVFWCATAIFICWVLFISFSLLNYNFADFLLCSVFVAILLLSIFKSVHFIYLVVLFVLLAMSSGNADAGYNGRYIYPFVILPAYVLLFILTSFFSETVKIKPKNVIFVILAAVISLLLMMKIYNPFNFEMPMWKIQQFFHLHRIWRPAYESNLELRYTHIFNELYILNVVSIVILFCIPYFKTAFGQEINKADEHLESETYTLPKINLPLILIAVMTIYMAIRSRRFIPVAAIAACPVIAMFIDQLVRVISAVRNFRENRRLVVGTMGYNLQLFCIYMGALAVVCFGTWWGLKFKIVYLGSWPRDPKFTSIFMRMTDSGQKPFYACRFLKDNKLKGNMFNYWTEGGFIAFGQEPDPDTGKIPLQLFMDGRAQAAYDRRTFDLWSYIIGGGPVTADILWRAGSRGQEITNEDYLEIGQWMDEQLRKYDVWAVLMPQSRYSRPPQDEFYTTTSYHALQGLERNLDWRLVFFNNTQRLYVDVKTPQGKALFDGIFDGKTLYPDDFHSNLIRARSWLFYRMGIDEKKKGLDFAIEAFELNESPAPMLEIILVAARFAELRPQVQKFCEEYIKRFTENESKWAEEDGYRDRVEAGRLAAYYLESIAQAQNNTELVGFYQAQQSKCVDELIRVAQVKRW
jgi:hypothetical protein